MQPNKNKEIVIFIPAMGNNLRIPRKFVRKLNGKPLILYSIELSKSLIEDSNIIVICDDEEIDLIARRNEVGSYLIKSTESFPRTFNNTKIISLMTNMEKQFIRKFDFIIWMGPSSPMIKNHDVKEAIDFLDTNNYDAVFSASLEPQRNWTYTDTYQPSFREVYNKLNTDFLHRETGAFFIMRRCSINEEGYIGKIARPFFIDESRSLEIYSFNDWWVAEKLLKRKHILFVVAGNSEIGMGHVYRSVMLAQEFSDHDISFLTIYGGSLAFDYIHNLGYKCQLQNGDENIADLVIENLPDLVINDILDTEGDYIKKIKQEGIKVLNFEDEGTGAEYADQIVNALFPKSTLPNMLSGHQYFCLRDEFYNIPKIYFKEKIENIFISFGGTDFQNLTLRILKLLINKVKVDTNVKIHIVTGLGYKCNNEMDDYLESISVSNNTKIEWLKNGTQKISEIMGHSDCAIVSAGRTVFELTHLNIPSIIIASNKKELLHTFGVSAGHRFLGLHSEIDDELLLNEINLMVFNSEHRKKIFNEISKYDFSDGKDNIVQLIKKQL